MLKSFILTVIVIQLVCLVKAQTEENSSNDLEAIHEYPLIENAPLYRGFRVFTAGKSTYAVSYLRQNLFRAQISCAARGMTLASINTFQVDEEIRGFLLSEGFLNSGNDVQFWLSGADLAAAGEPSSTTEHCISISYDGKWNDSSCLAPHYYICEQL